MNTDIMEEIISSIESVLPLSVVKVDDELTCNDAEHVVLFTSDGLPELLDTLSDRLQISKEQIILFFENDKGEIVRVDEHTDLRTAGAIRLQAVVGIIPEECKQCKKAFSCGMAPEFHCCVRDKTVPGFSSKSPAGPIERTKPGEAQKDLMQDWCTGECYSEPWFLQGCQQNQLKGQIMTWPPEIWRRIAAPIIIQSHF